MLLPPQRGVGGLAELLGVSRLVPQPEPQGRGVPPCLFRDPVMTTQVRTAAESLAGHVTDWSGIEGQLAVSCEQQQAFHLGLGQKQPIKGVAV